MHVMRCALVVALAAVPTGAESFGVNTHAAITLAAFERSVLVRDPTMASRLGVPAAGLLRDQYVDVGDHGFFVRHANDFEDRIIRGTFLRDPRSIVGWIMRGAIREDDNPAEQAREGYDDDPWGNIYRVIRHFFDPVNNRGLYVAGIPPYERSPDWAIGAVDAFAETIQPEAGRRNHFSAFDAREAMWRALTGRSADGTELAVTGMSRAELRRAYWATTLRALGDVLHLNQDVAQPQHTRNEAHGGSEFDDGLTLKGHKSVIESYVDTAFGGKRLTLPGNQVAQPLQLSLAPHPIPAFSRYSDYWSTAVGDVAAGRGLADFSNREFFTAGRILGSSANDYALPPNSAAQYTIRVVTNPVNWAGQPLAGEVRLLERGVADLQAGTTVVVPAVGESAWDQFYRSRTGRSRYSLNQYVYQAQAEQLLPRAIAYSAGLIDYFFRGRLQVSLPAQGVYALADHSLAEVATRDTGGFRRIRANVRNLTPGEALQAAGRLVAVVAFRRNQCYASPTLEGSPGSPDYDARLDCKTLEEEIAVSGFASVDPAAINGAGGQEVAFDFPAGRQVPINATDVRLQVVYRGPLGTEPDAVVVETRDVSEPSFFNFDNHSECFGGPGTPLAPLDVRFNASTVAVASTRLLEGGKYSRIALLAEPYGYTIAPSSEPGAPYQVVAVTNQLDGVAAGVPNPTPFRKARPVGPTSSLYGIAGYGYYNWVLNGDGVQDGFLGAQACTAPFGAQPQPMEAIRF
jgi:hypothetical protein